MRPRSGSLLLSLSFVSSILSSSSPNALMSPGRELLFLWLFVGWSNRRCKFPRLFLNHKLFHHLYHRVHFLSSVHMFPQSPTFLRQQLLPKVGWTSHTLDVVSPGQVTDRILELGGPSKGHYFQEKLHVYRLRNVTAYSGLWKNPESTHPFTIQFSVSQAFGTSKYLNLILYLVIFHLNRWS